MKQNILKLIFPFLSLFLISSLSSAASAQTTDIPDGFGEYTLENGMKVFILEDFSSAPVRIEYTVHAGISAQTPDTAGFFPLYTRLFQNAGKTSYGAQGKNWFPAAASSTCEADSARYIITVASSQTESALRQFAYCAFSTLFSDADLKAQFSELKTAVMNYAFSTAGFINSSIDARVYAEAPWTQDTGIYPSLFTNTPDAQVRTILTAISHTYYTPQNSALFISGGITKKTALALAEKTFGSWPAGTIQIPQNSSCLLPETDKTKQQRRFVLYDPVFSADITQIVVQYKGLSMTQADTAAAVFNAHESSVKTELLSHEELAVRGADYINAAAAHKNGQSRLIFQSLLEKTKASPCKQAEAFLSCIKKAADNAQNSEFVQAQHNLVTDYRSVYGSSSSLMDKLSELWAVENKLNDRTAQPLISYLLSRPGDIINFNAESFRTAYDNEEPFVFVLVNSSTYKKYAAEFKNAGYEPVTQKNGSWYTQELYKNVLKNHTAGASTPAADEEQDDASWYASQNAAQFSSLTLSNGISIVFKENKFSSSALIMISISGGKISSADTPGFFSILINALAENIQKELNTQKKNGLIEGVPSVLAETDFTSGIITVECLSPDINTVIQSISRAVIYGNVQPAQADGLIYDARSRKQLHDSDTGNQLYSSAIREIFAGTPYTALFDSSRDILENTQFMTLAASYPSLLDASRYTIIVTGTYPKEAVSSELETSFGILLPQTERKNNLQAVPVPKFPDDKNVSVQLRHLFLTDVDAGNAGPQPAVLVPTKNFSDPVQYWLPSPPPSSPDFAVFNALVYTLRSRLEKNAAEVSPDITVTADAASYGIQAAVFTLTHIGHTRQADALYEKTAAQLCKDAADKDTWKNLAKEMFSCWILGSLSGTQSNRGTALLMHEGIEQADTGNIEKDAAQYLADYETVNNVSQKTVTDICSSYVTSRAPLRLYSADAVK
jgi:predicted Zn-dependent peptidase